MHRSFGVFDIFECQLDLAIVPYLRRDALYRFHDLVLSLELECGRHSNKGSAWKWHNWLE